MVNDEQGLDGDKNLFDILDLTCDVTRDDRDRQAGKLFYVSTSIWLFWFLSFIYIYPAFPKVKSRIQFFAFPNSS